MNISDYDSELLDNCSQYLVKAKNVTNNKWIYGFYVPTESSTYGFVFGSLFDKGEVYKVYSASVCRCTTIKDFSDDYVFESDLVCLKVLYESNDKPLLFIGTVLEIDHQWCIIGKTGETLFALPYLYSDDILNWNIEILGSSLDYIRKV